MDAWRLIVGTLTIFPVKVPRVVDSRVAGQASALAPLVGAILAIAVAVPSWLVGEWLPPTLVATMCIATLALVTRGIHLDGLADTADGLGAAKNPEQTLAIMRQSDIGPFGVITLILALGLQVSALAVCFSEGAGAPALALALLISRATLPHLTRRPSARQDGLGQHFAGSTGHGHVAFAIVVTLALGAITLLLGSLDAESNGDLINQIIFAPVALIPMRWLERKSLRRLGGLTGDVYGAAIEVAFTSSLVLAAWVVSA